MTAAQPPTGRTRQRPQRSCIACRQPRAKRELIRIVRTPAGAVELDPTGKRSGRGSYICRERTCWEAGLRGSVLERSLRLAQRLPSETRDRLLREALGALPLPHSPVEQPA